MKASLCVLISSLALALALPGLARADSPWDLQAVNSIGEATHPKVGAAVEEANKVTVEGIALNASAELLDPAQMWQVYVQAESPDKGGIAAFAAIFYDNSVWPRYPSDVEAGDRVRVEGYVAFHRGKTNINERHSAAPELRFTVTILQKAAGMPAPIEIPDIGACVAFDDSRTTGAELYQCQWVQLNDVHIASGTWAAGETLTITDASGATLPLLLSARGDFNSYSAPTGDFSVRGIFDQEDLATPWTDSYRLWVKSWSDFILPSDVGDWYLYQ